METSIARALIFILFLVFHTDVRQQTNQDRTVYTMVRSRLIVKFEFHFTHRLMNLEVNVLPLANAQVVQIILLTLLAELVARQRFLLLLDIFPQIHKRQEVRLFMEETTVLII